MKFTLKNISSHISASTGGYSENSFSEIITDSRSGGNFGDSLFVAIKTNRNNGHHFIGQMFERGVRCFLVSEKINTNDFEGAGFLFVENTLDALQKLAAYKRSLFKKPVIAITGSNGKTIVKEWLNQLLQKDFVICRSPKSFNSQIGVPLSVWQLKERHTLGIFEAGISLPGEMERLEKIIRPDIGIVTNIKAAHDAFFTSRLQKAQEKLKLFTGCKTLFYCADHEEISEVLTAKEFVAVKKISWGKNKNADLRIENIRQEKQTEIIAFFKNEKIKIKIPFTDDGSIENAMHCWLYLLNSGLKKEQIEERMKKLAPVEMRLELKQAINNCSLINDAYSSDIESLSIALDFLNRQHQHPKKTVILSDILQTGKNEGALYQEVAALLKTKKVTRLIGIGKEIKKHADSFWGEKEFFSDTDTFLKDFANTHFSNEAILLKGSSLAGFEKIGRLLQQKSHDTVLEFNLNNFVHNLNYYRGLLKVGTGIMGMVKAFSYGSGSFEIAGMLQHHNVNYLAVAYADEGVELRKGGIILPIMVMNPEPQSFDDLLHYNLEPEIFSHRIFDFFAEFAKFHSEKNIPAIHVKIDTGMHRLGFEPKEIELLCKKIKANPQLKIASVFSHLAGSDEPGLDDFTREQLQTFITCSEKIMGCVSYKVLRHLCNSAAIARFPQAHFDMVRLGIGMYGIGANAEEQKKLVNAGVLKSTISQIKQLHKGETVGYNRKGKVEKETTIATVPLGYADGYSRKLGNGKGCMYVNGKHAPVIGNVCMDMTMIDITGIDAREGDDVIIFDSPETIIEMAKQSETIPYEILTAISPRVKRVYLEE